MERREIIALAAAPLRTHLMSCFAALTNTASASLCVSERHWLAIQALCDALNLETLPTSKDGAMLGGASARLQLCDWQDVSLGGAIWYAGDLDATHRLFAVAHELGHFALHRGEGVALHPPCDAQALDEHANSEALLTDAIPNNRVEVYTPRARRELEANAFAAELLAPRAEVRRLFLASASCDTAALAAHFGISTVLTRQRLVESVLCANVHPDEESPVVEQVDAPANSDDDFALAAQKLLDRLDPSQQAAATAHAPALVVAGPGAGKTATLVGRVAYLVGEQGAQPEHVLALTFSNRAAGEMRERLLAAGLPGERVPALTIHAFAASLLREYAACVPVAPDEPPLGADFRILDTTDAYLLLEELLPDLKLHYYRSLAQPTVHLPTLNQDFSQARNQLWTPEQYLRQVEAMPLTPEKPADGAAGKAKQQQKQYLLPGTFSRKQIAQARERANAYAVWDRALRQRNLVDYGGLILRAVELLRADAAARTEVQARYPHVLVDEFQDTNLAAWELLALVAGESGAGLWVVGDRNQAIYRWRGASPRNLRRLVERYPALTIVTLDRNYRSTPAIVQLGAALATQMAGQPLADGQGNGRLQDALLPGALQAVREPRSAGQSSLLKQEDFADAEHERLGIAEAVRRLRVQGYPYGDQAILCRTRKQVAQVAQALTDQDIPVSEVSNLFAQEAVKDTLTFLALAAGPDGRALLRANALAPAFGAAPIPTGELRRALRLLAERRLPLPWALLQDETRCLLREAGVGETSCRSLKTLAQAANDARTAYGAIFVHRQRDAAAPSRIADALANFLLQPGGYAWRLAHRADGMDTQRSAGDQGAAIREARLALAALGELAGIALHFDIRWANEPGFRARLIRATRHKRRQYAASGTPGEELQTSSSADTPAGDTQADVASATSALVAVAGDASEMVNPVACFLRYVDALRSTDGAPTVAAGDADAVRILTLHGSKGLEFPVVYLPALAERTEPVKIAVPPGFREVDAAEGDPRAAEERCLFYVGLTRARDVVAFSRAFTYAKASEAVEADDDEQPTAKTPREAAPAPALQLLYGNPLFESAAPLLDDSAMQRLRAQQETAQHPANWVNRQSRETVSGDAKQADKPLYQLADLKQYLRCARQFRYAQTYQLLDPSDSAPQRFHRFMRRALRLLNDLHAVQPQAQWHDVERALQPLWQEEGPAGDAHAEDYLLNAMKLSHQEWDALCLEPADASVGPRQEKVEMVAELHDCRVAVTVDRLIADDTTNTDTLIRLHMRRPQEGDLDDLDLRLYAIAHQQMFPGRQARILVVYIGAPLANADGDGDGDGADADAHEQSRIVDVTGKARSAAHLYLKPDRRQRSALDKLDEAARAIAAGRFAPTPKDDDACDSCPYCYVCPADLPATDE